MEARNQVRAPVRVKRTEISVFSACCARTAAPLSDEGRGLKLPNRSPPEIGGQQRPSAMRGED